MSGNWSFSDDPLAYKCFVLNVRSHREYVCLEIDNCPSRMELSETEGFLLDSSHVVVPVFDKIRFNIKCTDSSFPSWFRSKLEIFAENNQIYPRRFCAKCEENEKKLMMGNNLILPSPSDVKHFSTNTDSVWITAEVAEKCKENLERDASVNTIVTSIEKEVLTDDVSIKDLFLHNRISKSEIFNVDNEDSTVFTKSFSLPEIRFRNECLEKSVQTQVSLGKQDLSDNSLVLDDNEFIKKIDMEFAQPLTKSNGSNILNNKVINSNQNVMNDVTFICSTSSFDKNKKIKYWSLINTARHMLKMNKDILELNTILKSLEIEKSMDNTNLISSLSPVHLILKLKSLNRSSSIYSLLSDNPEMFKLNTKGAVNNVDCDNKLIYFDKLNKALLKHSSDSNNDRVELGNENNGKRENVKSESLLSMDKLFNMQKHMLRMMGTFLRRNDS